ncbi:MAG: hypothetical protein H6526_04960 [Actinobacteria bacterium]|nr:hypothetical protein [Actinomycetota bacterium]MCB8997245.1 hypothetical protein [Actinomycetota bacterium]MCB9414615.1 hypothetical protein [Actinomycetota bacterium]MCB9423557.1 hypothetical protein [Actinomycetota bacterium]HRY09027.1 HAD domain-containing protein [Candidatus Nanopelagicales bacterium]
MTKPTLYLDIDGVLNAIPREIAPPGYSVRMMDGFTIHLHTELPAMVTALREHFDIVWFTLWNERAPLLMGPQVGLPDTPYLFTSWHIGEQVMLDQGYPPAAIDRVLYAKSPILAMEADRATQWVWIDDAHGHYDHAYLTQEGFDPANFRLLRTDLRTGLTWADVERAIAWVPELGVVAEGFETRSGTHHGPGSTAGRAEAVGE